MGLGFRGIFAFLATSANKERAAKSAIASVTVRGLVNGAFTMLLINAVVPPLVPYMDLGGDLGRKACLASGPLLTAGLGPKYIWHRGFRLVVSGLCTVCVLVKVFAATTADDMLQMIEIVSLTENFNTGMYSTSDTNKKTRPDIRCGRVDPEP